jgi:SAM-dependent methyltransferase
VKLDAQDLDETRRYWAARACGSVHSSAAPHTREFYREVDAFRFGVEPVIQFANFTATTGRRVLEVGTGTGGDLARFLEAGAEAVGLDLSPSAVQATGRRIALEGLPRRVIRADALCLPFGDDMFDLVWSWGVLHHTGRIAAALAEVHRVLRPGGETRLMLYHRPSWVALAAWIRWALLRGRPFQGLKRVVSDHVESPGTLALSVGEIRSLLCAFERVEVHVVGTHWDRKFFPGLGRLAGSRMGWFALVRAWKPQRGPTVAG